MYSFVRHVHMYTYMYMSAIDIAIDSDLAVRGGEGIHVLKTCLTHHVADSQDGRLSRYSHNLPIS